MEIRFSIYEDFLSLVFPKTCAGCTKSLFKFEDQLCVFCKAAIPVTNYHLRPFDNDLVRKIEGLTSTNRVMAFMRFTKMGLSQKLLHALKYKNKADLAVELGRLYGQLLLEHDYIDIWDIIIPVPLHPTKQRRRGYNQSEKFGQGLAQAINIPIGNQLFRRLYTETQTNKSRLERLENVGNVFGIKYPSSLKNKRILLVDDVMTTGATLISCANVLNTAEVKLIDMTVIAAGKSA